MDYPQYDPDIADSPLSDHELQSLDEMLGALPGSTMNIEVMDGYLTALLVGPRLVDRLPTRAWLPAVWGGDGEGTAPFQSNRQRKKATVLVLRRLQSIACQLRAGAERWEPIFSVAESEGDELADAEDWCIGFLEAVALDHDAWGSFFDDRELASSLRPIVLLGASDEALSAAEVESLRDPHVRDEMSRAVTDGVMALVARR
jgi:uncharacterized protein